MKKAESCWHMSYGCFQEGIQIFNKINDKSNESLLNSNAGRLMRLCANAYVDNGKEFSNEEQHYLLRVRTSSENLNLVCSLKKQVLLIFRR